MHSLIHCETKKILTSFNRSRRCVICSQLPIRNHCADHVTHHSVGGQTVACQKIHPVAISLPGGGRMTIMKQKEYCISSQRSAHQTDPVYRATLAGARSRHALQRLYSELPHQTRSRFWLTHTEAEQSTIVVSMSCSIEVVHCPTGTDAAFDTVDV